MNDVEFHRMIGIIGHSFTHTPKLTKEFLAALLARIEHIDGRHCEQITARVCDLEKFPENLGSTILGIWRSLDPAAAVPDDSRDRFASKCPVCDPGPWQGQIVAFKRNQDGTISKTFFDCPRCKPSSQYAASREQIAGRGYIVPRTQWDVATHYYRMFAANNPDLARRVGPRMGELLADPRRMVVALRETPDERGVE